MASTTPQRGRCRVTALLITLALTVSACGAQQLQKPGNVANPPQITQPGNVLPSNSPVPPVPVVTPAPRCSVVASVSGSDLTFDQKLAFWKERTAQASHLGNIPSPQLTDSTQQWVAKADAWLVNAVAGFPSNVLNLRGQLWLADGFGVGESSILYPTLANGCVVAHEMSKDCTSNQGPGATVRWCTGMLQEVNMGLPIPTSAKPMEVTVRYDWYQPLGTNDGFTLMSICESLDPCGPKA